MRKLLLALALLLPPLSAYADTCATTLQPAFTGAQATTLCSRFGTLNVTGTASNYETVAGAGTTTADAAALSATKFVHQITGANGTVGWKLPTVTASNRNQVHFLLNTTAGVAKIYAQTGGTVNGGAADAAFSALTGIKPIVCVATAAATWICS